MDVSPDGTVTKNQGHERRLRHVCVCVSVGLERRQEQVDVMGNLQYTYVYARKCIRPYTLFYMQN